MTAGPCLGCTAGYHCHVGRDAAGALIPTPRCASHTVIPDAPVCEKRASVQLNLRLYKQPLFGKPGWVPSCPSCLNAVKLTGAVLGMAGIVGEGAT